MSDRSTLRDQLSEALERLIRELQERPDPDLSDAIDHLAAALARLDSAEPTAVVGESQVEEQTVEAQRSTQRVGIDRAGGGWGDVFRDRT